MVDEKLSTNNRLPTDIKKYVSDSIEIIEEDIDRIIQMAWED